MTRGSLVLAAAFLAGCTPASAGLGWGLAVGVAYSQRDSAAAQPAADGKVNEVDCSKPVDPSLVNWRCK